MRLYYGLLLVSLTAGEKIIACVAEPSTALSAPTDAIRLSDEYVRRFQAEVKEWQMSDASPLTIEKNEKQESKKSLVKKKLSAAIDLAVEQKDANALILALAMAFVSPWETSMSNFVDTINVFPLLANMQPQDPFTQSFFSNNANKDKILTIASQLVASVKGKTVGNFAEKLRRCNEIKMAADFYNKMYRTENIEENYFAAFDGIKLLYAQGRMDDVRAACMALAKAKASWTQNMMAANYLRGFGEADEADSIEAEVLNSTMLSSLTLEEKRSEIEKIKRNKNYCP